MKFDLKVFYFYYVILNKFVVVFLFHYQIILFYFLLFNIVILIMLNQLKEFMFFISIQCICYAIFNTFQLSYIIQSLVTLFS